MEKLNLVASAAKVGRDVEGEAKFGCGRVGAAEKGAPPPPPLASDPNQASPIIIIMMLLSPGARLDVGGPAFVEDGAAVVAVE